MSGTTKLIVCLAVLLAVLLTGCGYLAPYLARLDRTPSQTESVNPARSSTPAESLTKKQLIAAFEEVASSAEYGTTDNKIRKWTVPLKLAVHGAPTTEDQAALDRAMEWLNDIDGFPGIEQVQSDANVDAWFVKESEMKNVMDGYVPGNWGFFWTYYGSESITKAQVAIATDVTTQEARNHLIFEELIQSTGLQQDLYDYEDSIFYGNWTIVQQPSGMDAELVRMLYMPEIKYGMAIDQAISVLNDKYKPAE